MPRRRRTGTNTIVTGKRGVTADTAHDPVVQLEVPLPMKRLAGRPQDEADIEKPSRPDEA